MRKLMLSLRHELTLQHNRDVLLSWSGLGTKSRAIEATTAIMFAMDYEDENRDPLLYCKIELLSQMARVNAPHYLKHRVKETQKLYASHLAYNKDIQTDVAVKRSMEGSKKYWRNLITSRYYMFNLDTFNFAADAISGYCFEELIDYLNYR